jgi:hypothetical protein
MKPEIIKDISDIQTEIDQIQDDLYNSQAIPHTQSSSVQSLPTGAVDGVTTNLEISGLSLVNSVANVAGIIAGIIIL